MDLWIRDEIGIFEELGFEKLLGFFAVGFREELGDEWATLSVEMLTCYL